MPSNDFMQFQRNLRRTALGVKFGRQLLTNPDSLNPKTITAIVKAMGLKIPDDVQLAADAAQAMVTGAAAMNALKTASDVSDYRQVITMSANSVRTMGMIAEKMEWVDHDTAVLISVGTDIAAIVGSAGADAGAWVRLGLTVGQEAVMSEMEASFLARKAVVDDYKGWIQAETANFKKSLVDLQDGKLGIFSFLAANAANTRVLFKQAIVENPAFKPIVDKMPGLHLLPYGDWTWSSKASVTSFWGQTYSAKDSITVQGLAMSDPARVVDFLLSYLIMPSAWSYFSARDYYLRLGKADLFNVALFAMFSKDFVLSPSTDLMSEFVKYQISPSDIGETNVFKGVESVENYGIISNYGFSVKEFNIDPETMQKLDLAGNVAPLLQDRDSKDLLNKRFSFPAGYGSDGINRAFNWREMANFVAVLDFLDLIYSDPQYESFKNSSQFLPVLDVFPKIEDFKKRFLTLYNKSLIRRVNTASKMNMAYFLNTQPSKLNIQTREGNSSVVSVK